ncbi:MAG: ExbD/TolR family protein, partial [Opitutales bacterium]
MSLIVRKRRPPSINIVPLVDVLTVLLFFFLMTMQFKRISALNITLPEIQTAGENKIDEKIVITLSEKGDIHLNERAVSREELRSAMELAGANTPEIPVLLVADEEAPLKQVTAVMDICRSNKLNKIRLQSR